MEQNIFEQLAVFLVKILISFSPKLEPGQMRLFMFLFAR